MVDIWINCVDKYMFFVAFSVLFSILKDPVVEIWFRSMSQ